MHPNIIVHTRRPQIGPRKSIVQRPLSPDRTRADRPLHKDAVPM